jgi:hypothetical protein
MTQNCDNVSWISQPRGAAGRQPVAPAVRCGSRLAAIRAKRLSGAQLRSEAADTKMTKTGSTRTSAANPRAAAREARAERLAAALKANLHRRKAQAQARERAAEAGQSGHEAKPGGNKPDGNNESRTTIRRPGRGS